MNYDSGVSAVKPDDFPEPPRNAILVDKDGDCWTWFYNTMGQGGWAVWPTKTEQYLSTWDEIRKWGPFRCYSKFEIYYGY